jgi:hypothetical protein
MNDSAALVMTDVATVWEIAGTNEFAQKTYAAPYLIACNYMDGGELQVSEDGSKFAPKGTFRTFDARPSLKSYVAFGDHLSSTSPSGENAFQVKRVVSKTPFRTIYGETWQKRYTLYTG